VCVPKCVGVAPKGCSGKGLKGLAATRTRRRGGGVWSPHTARPWRGRGVATAVAARGARQGKARLGPRQRAAARLGFAVRVRAHARGFWSSRAVAWPCRARGTGIPGPRHDTVARGDGVCGARRRRDGSLHKNGAKAGKGRGPRDCYRGFIEGPWLMPAAGEKVQ
jgi:hypothetical protein